MINDKPIATTADGRLLFDNTPTVVSVLVPIIDWRKVVAVVRANDPGKGKLGLPGGYHMRGETWQQAGCREVLEETGIVLNPKKIHLISIFTDEYGNNLIICQHDEATKMKDYNPEYKVPGEVDGLRLINSLQIKDFGDWAFRRHYLAVKDFLRG